jgi:hypothetical protein
MPNPKAQPIILSTKQQALLEQIASRTTNSYNLVTRTKLILGAARGVNNTALSQQLQLHAQASQDMATAMARGSGATNKCRSRGGE